MMVHRAASYNVYQIVNYEDVNLNDSWQIHPRNKIMNQVEQIQKIFQISFVLDVFF